MFRTWFLSTSTMPVDQEATVDKKYSSADASPTSLRNSSSAAGSILERVFRYARHIPDIWARAPCARPGPQSTELTKIVLLMSTWNRGRSWGSRVAGGIMCVMAEVWNSLIMAVGLPGRL